MTTDFANFSTPIRRELHLISSTEDPAMWSHPVLDLFGKENKVQEFQEDIVHRAKLYLVPTTFGEEYEDCLLYTSDAADE